MVSRLVALWHRSIEVYACAILAMSTCNRVDVVVWNELAEAAAQGLRKGSKVEVEGYLTILDTAAGNRKAQVRSAEPGRPSKDPPWHTECLLPILSLGLGSSVVHQDTVTVR